MRRYLVSRLVSGAAIVLCILVLNFIIALQGIFPSQN